MVAAQPMSDSTMDQASDGRNKAPKGSKWLCRQTDMFFFTTAVGGQVMFDNMYQVQPTDCWKRMRTKSTAGASWPTSSSFSIATPIRLAYAGRKNGT